MLKSTEQAVRARAVRWDPLNGTVMAPCQILSISRGGDQRPARAIVEFGDGERSELLASCVHVQVAQ